MASEQPASQPPSKGLSLYANLLDNAAPRTISGAPVTYSRASETSEQDDAANKQQAIAATIRFQPTKRPQLAAQKAKAKAIASKLASVNVSTAPVDASHGAGPSEAVPAVPKLSVADWTATVSEDEDINAYAVGARVRGGKKRKKKNQESMHIQHDWDDIYDPSRPNNYEEYKHSEEKIREVREWKDVLYKHRMKRRSDSLSSNTSEHRPLNKQFAPPPSFAPPHDANDDITRPSARQTDAPDSPSSEDTSVQRRQMNQAYGTLSTNPVLSTTAPLPPPPPPASSLVSPPPPPVNIETAVPGQVFRAPVKYAAPPVQSHDDVDMIGADDIEKESTEAENPEASRSNRPGQKGFAERLLTKYGWTKGSGLGAQGQGIVNALYAKADKRKKKSDAEGGGYATPATTGRILGGNKSKEAREQEEGKFGSMSEVVKLEGMLNGMDVQAELSKDSEQGGLMQEIGEECGEKYGSIERVFIHIPDDDSDAAVFIRFVSQLSALRAVNALEGRIFSGNTIRARFWDREKFDDGVYV